MTMDSPNHLRAIRIAQTHGLSHRITIAAAVKIVCEAGYHDTQEVEDIAVSLYRELAQRDVPAITRQSA
jgi:hypothetical protein